jgi:hypothetical protein
MLMGMFDRVRCKYPLPDPDAQDLEFQSKTTPAQWLDDYIITQDGRLLHEAYEIRADESEDSSRGGFMERIDQRWETVDFSGPLEIHARGKSPEGETTWYAYWFWVKDGRVADLQRSQEMSQS